jgi:hypothetical protein
MDTNAVELGDHRPESRPSEAGKAERRLSSDRVLWLALGLAVAACLLIYFHVPYVNGPRGPKQWMWPYMHRDVFPQSLLKAAWRLALGGAVIGGLSWLVLRRMRPGVLRRTTGLAALVCWGVFFVWVSLVTATPHGLSQVAKIVKSPIWTSYFTLALWIQEGRQPPLGETLQRYAELLPDLPLHTSTHPPGAVLASYGMLRAFQNHPALSAGMGRFYRRIGADPEQLGVESLGAQEVTLLSLGFLVVLVGQLGVFPLFWLVRRSMRDSLGPGGETESERVAWAAAAVWALYPALVLMVPAFDLLYPTAALLCLYTAVRGLNDHPAAWGVVLALAFMAAITFTFTLLLLIPMLCLMAWLDLSRRAASLRPKAVLQQARPGSAAGRRLWILICTTVIACVAIDALLRYVLGIHLLQIFFAAVQNQNEQLLPKLNRTFRVWVFYNVWDFLLFAGAPLAVLAVAGFARTFREWRNKPPVIVPALAVFPITVLAVDLSHQLSAETSRVWLFLAPGIAWAGAAELVRRSGKRWLWVLAGLLLAQTLFIYICRTNMMLWGF